jgi:hypothetical protein
MGLWYSGIDDYTSPSRFYFWTLSGKDDGFVTLPAAPSGRHIIDIAFQSSDVEDSREFRRRCQPQGGATTTFWRGVVLCDTAHLQPVGQVRDISEEFQEAVSYFKSRVDGMYADTYWRMFSDALTHVLAALGVWCALLLGWTTFRWIIAAPAG